MAATPGFRSARPLTADIQQTWSASFSDGLAACASAWQSAGPCVGLERPAKVRTAGSCLRHDRSDLAAHGWADLLFSAVGVGLWEFCLRLHRSSNLWSSTSF
jgi:hypothetical protein